MKKKLFLIISSLFIAVSIFVVINFDFNHEDKNKEGVKMEYKLKIKVNENDLIFVLENNETVENLIKKLQEKEIVVKAQDYGNFEKVGSLGFSLPANDEKITTKPGDLVLYDKENISLFYDSNTWSYTKIGKISNKNPDELKNILGSSDVTLTLSLIKEG